jgi:hypothetical protein
MTNPTDKELREAAERVQGFPVIAVKYPLALLKFCEDAKLLAAHALRPAPKISDGYVKISECALESMIGRERMDLLRAAACYPIERPAPIPPPIRGNGAEDDTPGLQARVNLAADTARPAAPLGRGIDKEQAKRIISHINDRCSKSKLASPSINISRDGWQMIVQLLEDACTNQS